MYRLLNWIDESMLVLSSLCINNNPHAIDIVKKRLDKMDKKCWKNLSLNRNAIDILIDNLDKIHYDYLGLNEAYASIIKHNHIKIDWSRLCEKEDREAIELIRNNLDKVDWCRLSKNAYSIDILRQNLDKVVQKFLWNNENPDAIELMDLSRCERIDIKDFVNFVNRFNNSIRHIDFIKHNLDEIYYKFDNRVISLGHLYSRIKNVDIIRMIIDKEIGKYHIYWKGLSANPYAINILRENKEWIDWKSICENENAYDIIIENLDKIDISDLCKSKDIRFLELLKDNIYRIPIDNLYYLIDSNWYVDWKLDLISDKKIIKEMFPVHKHTNIYIKEFIKFTKNGDKKRLEFIRRWFNIEKYYEFISECEAIFE